jgi:hypothetical protein
MQNEENVCEYLERKLASLASASCAKHLEKQFLQRIDGHVHEPF